MQIGQSYNLCLYEYEDPAATDISYCVTGINQGKFVIQNNRIETIGDDSEISLEEFKDELRR